jgi:hypothetical protein
LLAACAVAQLGAANSAFAYAAYGPVWPGPPVTVKYSYINMLDGGLLMPNGNPLPTALIRGSIEEAFGLWASVAPIHFVEVPDDGLPHADQIRFRHLYINGPDPPPPADPVAKAQVTCLGYGFGCEVQFDNSDRWLEVGTVPNPDILGAATHEIGHILGLYHTDVVGANMYWIFHRFQGLGTGFLLQDDIDGIRALYGAGVGSVTPIPEPATIAICFFAAAGLVFRRRTR